MAGESFCYSRTSLCCNTAMLVFKIQLWKEKQAVFKFPTVGGKYEKMIRVKRKRRQAFDWTLKVAEQIHPPKFPGLVKKIVVSGIV